MRLSVDDERSGHGTRTSAIVPLAGSAEPAANPPAAGARGAAGHEARDADPV